MKEVFGNIWEYHALGHPIVITTNGNIKKDGHAIMGCGIALDAKRAFSALPQRLGQALKLLGNHVFYFQEFNLFTFPTKYSWRQNSDIQLIETSLMELKLEVDVRKFTNIYLVRPGCSHGNLKWEDVRTVVSKYLDDRFTVVQL